MTDTERNMLTPFEDAESAVALLGVLMEKHGFNNRKVRYLLAVINKLINDGKTIFKRTPPETLRGLSEGGRRNVEASFVARTSNLSDRGDQTEVGPEEQRGLFLGWDEIERNLEQWARTDNCWFDNADDYLEKTLNKKIGNGSEANVYYQPPYVIKTIGCRFNPQEMLDRITITNFLFPETRLELVGLGRREDGEFCFVVRQPFIVGEYVEDKYVHLDVLNDFREDPDGIYAGFVNDHFILGDLHDRNILRSREGNLYVIDCNVWLNTPEIGKGGKWTIPEVEYSQESVVRMNRTLESLLPGSVDRQWMESNFADEDNHLKEQLAQTGRFDGTLRLRSKDGLPMDICLQVDPEEPDRLLWIRKEHLAVLVPQGFRPSSSPFTEEEIQSLREGRSVVHEGRRYAFSLNKGKICSCKGYTLTREKPHIRIH